MPESTKDPKGKIIRRVHMTMGNVDVVAVRRSSGMWIAYAGAPVFGDYRIAAVGVRLSADRARLLFPDLPPEGYDG